MAAHRHIASITLLTLLVVLTCLHSSQGRPADRRQTGSRRASPGRRPARLIASRPTMQMNRNGGNRSGGNRSGGNRNGGNRNGGNRNRNRNLRLRPRITGFRCPPSQGKCGDSCCTVSRPTAPQYHQRVISVNCPSGQRRCGGGCCALSRQITPQVRRQPAAICAPWEVTARCACAPWETYHPVLGCLNLWH